MVFAILAISSTSCFNTWEMKPDELKQIHQEAKTTLSALSKKATPPHLHEALALQFGHPVGGAVEPLPLRVQHRVGDLPPGPAVQQHSQPHHAGYGDLDRGHRLVLAVHLEDDQQRHTGDQTGQDEEEEDEGWQAASPLPLPLSCRKQSRSEIG